MIQRIRRPGPKGDIVKDVDRGRSSAVPKHSAGGYHASEAPRLAIAVPAKTK